jgi:hypothetical protein
MVDDFLNIYSWLGDSDHNLQFNCWTEEVTNKDKQDYIDHIIKRIPNLSNIYIDNIQSSKTSGKRNMFKSNDITKSNPRSWNNDDDEDSTQDDLTWSDDDISNSNSEDDFKQNISKYSNSNDSDDSDSNNDKRQSSLYGRFQTHPYQTFTSGKRSKSLSDTDEVNFHEDSDSDQRASFQSPLPKTRTLNRTMSLSNDMKNLKIDNEEIVVKFQWKDSILKYMGLNKHFLPKFFITTRSQLNELKQKDQLIFPKDRDPLNGMAVTHDDYDFIIAAKDSRILHGAKITDNDTEWLDLTLAEDS